MVRCLWTTGAKKLEHVNHLKKLICQSYFHKESFRLLKVLKSPKRIFNNLKGILNLHPFYDVGGKKGKILNLGQTSVDSCTKNIGRMNHWNKINHTCSLLLLWFTTMLKYTNKLQFRFQYTTYLPDKWKLRYWVIQPASEMYHGTRIRWK